MERILVHFSANEQKLICSDPFRVSSYKVQYIEAHFDLGQNWTGYDSVRAVWWNDFATIGTVLDSLGVCRVPAEVLRRKGPVMVNLVGSISDGEVLTDRLTTYPVESGVVDANSRVDGPDPHPATPSQVEQFAAAVREDADRAEAGAAAAEESAQNASDSATSASNSAESAHDDKIAIEQAIAEVIQQIEDFEQVQVVVNTLPAGSQATSNFENGVLTLGIPKGDKGDTGNGIANIRKTSTSGLVDTYTITFTDNTTTTFAVTNGAKGDTGNGISSIVKTSTVGLVDTYTITYTDGNTSTFTVTNGEKGDKGDTGEVSLSELEDATIVQTLSDTEPYHFRRTNNGNGAGHREYDEIVGASVGWNQLASLNASDWTLSQVTFTESDGVITLTSLGSSTKTARIVATAGHKYYMSASVKNIDAVAGRVALFNTGGTVVKEAVNNATTDWVSGATIGSASSGDFIALRLANSSASGQSAQFENVQIIDLTLFNSTIADYVYSLEQSTAGSGVAWLKTHFPRLFDNGYQPYDSGSIKSVSGLEAHRMTSKNLFDADAGTNGYIDNNGAVQSRTYQFASDYIPVVAGEQYTISLSTTMSNIGIAYFDSSKAIILPRIDNNSRKTLTFTAISGASYVRFWFYFNSTTDLNPTIVKETYKAQFELGSTATDYAEYESHTYTLDPSVTLRGKFTLDGDKLKAVGDVWKSVGSIERKWKESDMGDMVWTYQNNHIFRTVPNDVKAGADIVCAGFTYVGKSTTNLTYDKTIANFSSGSNRIEVRYDAYDNVADFVSAVQGKKLCYELATPTTESATPYDSPQICDSNGTEEYVSDCIVPIGHNTEYPMTLVDTMPSANGNYTMKLTIANGKKTVTWESV